MEIKFKQYIILNRSLNMSLGKSCAMTAHASYLALREQEKKNKALINKWLKNGECVIVLEAYTSTQMFGLQQYFNRKGIINNLYIDECVVEGEFGEPNALATGVLTEEESELLVTMNLYSDISKMETTENNTEIEIYPIFGKHCQRCGNIGNIEEFSPDGPPYYYCSEECLNEYHSEQNAKGLFWRCTPATRYEYTWGEVPKISKQELFK